MLLQVVSGVCRWYLDKKKQREQEPGTAVTTKNTVSAYVLPHSHALKQWS